MSESASTEDYIQIAADIVSAFVSNNAVRVSELPSLIEAVHTSLVKAAEQKVEEPVAEAKAPAVPVKKSITDEFIICLEDGKKFKSLKRHLSTAYNMSPDEYRTKWGLSPDYPMVAPAYASARSSLARQMGLGRKRDDALEEVATTAPTHMEEAPQAALAAEAPRKRGRPRSMKTAA
ncbi:MucR family transcriptional regulator [Lichenihabitans psoromatis]|uniref:MucR family transcriptional regulator n=1 Tax=Lichenihabitans psoromatis TaxID=2528642 RepID=UPI0010360FF2|nr:MucR family transcriptional regulator [Lichenihabitans psoromatis]